MQRFRLSPLHVAVALPAVCLLTFLLIRRRETSEALPGAARGISAETPGGVESGSALPADAPSRRRSQDQNPFLSGNPAVIQAILDDLDRTDRSTEERDKFHALLKGQLDSLYTAHGIHLLPLFARLLGDASLPRDLRTEALTNVGRNGHPQCADFLARLAISGKIAPDSVALSLYTLGGLMTRVGEAHRTLPLRALCRQIYEGSLLSPEAEVRAAAVENLLSLSPPADDALATQQLVLLIRSDPASEVHAAAERVLLGDQGLALNNEWLATEAASQVAAAGADSDRARAMRLLVATKTETAKTTALSCLADGSELVRKLAILATGKLKIAEAVPLLAKMLGDVQNQDLQLRQHYVLKALEGIPGPESAAAVVGVISGDVEAELRGAAIVSLKANPALQDERLGPALLRLYEALPEGSAKDNALSLVSKNASPPAFELLQRCYGQAEGETRDRMASLLLQSPRRADFVQSNFGDLVRTPVGRYAISELAKAAPERAVREIQAFYVAKRGENLDEAARRSAIRALGSIGTPSSGAVLKSLLEVEEDRGLLGEIQSELDQIKAGR